MIIASGACGTRRAGQNIPVTIETASISALTPRRSRSLLASQFVEEGKLRWDSTLAEIFPELNDKMDSEFAKITPQEFAHSMTRSWPQKLLHRN